MITGAKQGGQAVDVQMFKTPKLPNGFHGRIFKGKLKEGSPRVCDELMQNSLTFDDEVTGSYHRGSNDQFSGSTGLGAVSSWSCNLMLDDHEHGHTHEKSMEKKEANFFHWMGGFSICKTTQEHASGTVIYVLQGGTKDSVTAIWVIYGLNSYQFYWPNCYFCQYMFTSFYSLIFEPTTFWLRGSLGDYSFSTNKRQAEDTGGGVCLRKAPECPVQLDFQSHQCLLEAAKNQAFVTQSNAFYDKGRH